MASPGILYVTMEPSKGLPPSQFHEWYNNEHGPTRLRLPHIFTNGLRYRATDGQKPEFLAVYDVTQMSHLDTETYTSLRANRSPREADTIGQVQVNREFYDLEATLQSPNFHLFEHLTDDKAEGTILVVMTTTLNDKEGAETEYLKWYKEEHMPMLSKVPGWLRTRLFKTSFLQSPATPLYIALHDYSKANELGGPIHRQALSTPWRDQISQYVVSKHRRVYSLFYVFGSAPRDLLNLAQLSAPTFTSQDGKTTTIPGPSASIRSYVTLPDGLVVPYQLEGNPDSKAPTVAFSNSLLTDLHMWDSFVAILKAKRPEFRILRYDTRGRHSIPRPPVPSTLDIVADDIIHLLGALRLPRLHALIGVSMGGATTLKFALKYPEKVAKIVACDFNVASSAANTQAWKDRIQVAETPLENGDAGIKKLAEVTVERWYHPSSMSKAVAPWMVEMVGNNNIEGFRYGCQALWDYDMKPEIKTCKVPVLLVVGEGDGKGALVKAMDGFKGMVGERGAHLAIVPATGHLPMVEDPEAFWKAIQDFL